MILTLEHSLYSIHLTFYRLSQNASHCFQVLSFDAHALYTRELGGQAHLQSDLPQFYTQMESSTFRAAHL